jgi:AraC-like DNA-binding protein
VHHSRTIAVNLSWPFLRVFEQLGVPPEFLIGRETALYGLTPEQYVDPTTRLPTEVVFDDVEGYIMRLQVPDIGLRAGLAALPGDFGAAELAARACPNVREALTVLARGFALLIDGVRLSTEVRGESLCLRLWTDPEITLPHWAVEFALLSLLRVGVGYANVPAGTAPHPLRVRFTHGPLAYHAACEQAFGCPIEFAAAENAIDVPAAVLDLPLRTADRTVAFHMRAQLDRSVAAAGDQPLVARIDAAITRRLVDGIPPIDLVAADLGKSPRTLHRHLAAQGTSYRELGKAAQRRLAIYYLQQTEMPIKEIAAALGFHNAPGFHRAFRLLTGQTPKACRDRVTAAASRS